jgi:hypothetical protein
MRDGCLFTQKIDGCTDFNVWSIQLSYKLRVFAWLVMYRGIPSKDSLVKAVSLMAFALSLIAQIRCSIFFGSANLSRVLEVFAESVFNAASGQGSLACCLVWRLPVSSMFCLHWVPAVLEHFHLIL